MVQNVFPKSRRPARCWRWSVWALAFGAERGGGGAELRRILGRASIGLERDPDRGRGDGRGAFLLDAWNNVTFAAGEVRKPRGGTFPCRSPWEGSVSLLYLACNLVYLFVLPLEAIQTAPEGPPSPRGAAGILGPVAVQAMGAASWYTFGA